MKRAIISGLILMALAVGLLGAAFAFGPSAEARNNEGKAALKRGDVRAATTAFAAAVKADPENSRFRFNLGLALAKAGAHQQAATELREAIRLDPANMDARRLLARIDAALAPSY